MKIKVSVIIPTYMEEKYIEDTLKSVKKQTCKAHEIIVCDSSSPDKTAKIAKKYADKIIVIKERGVSVGRNRGAKAASGNLLLFLDADTILMPDFIQNIVKAFSEKKDLVAASGYAKTYGRKRDRAIFYCMSEIEWATGELNIPLFYGICMAIRKDIFDKLGGFDSNRVTSEDWDIVRRAAKYGKCKVIRNAVAYSSPRRLEKGSFFGSIFFTMKNYIRYRFFGMGSKSYPPIR